MMSGRERAVDPEYVQDLCTVPREAGHKSLFRLQRAGARMSWWPGRQQKMSQDECGTRVKDHHVPCAA
jgi:hypothetical protein